MRTLVSFRSSAFNTSEPKPHYINPNCYGDDLAVWLQSRLRDEGVTTRGQPGQEDFGWYLNYEAGGCAYCFVVGYRPESDSDGTWIGWVERHRGVLGSLLGRRNSGIGRDGVMAIHAALSQAHDIHELRWHERDLFEKGHEEDGQPEP